MQPTHATMNRRTVIAPATIYNGKTPFNVIMVSKNSTAKSAVDLNGQIVAVNGAP